MLFRSKIEAEISAIKAKNPKAVIVVDAALLIEGGLYKKMDKVIVVCADEKTQIKRLTERDGLAIEDAKNRIASQMPLKEKRRYADFVIENVEGKSREEVKEEVKRVFDRLKDKR